MISNSSRLTISMAFFAVATVFGSIAARSVFAFRPTVFSTSPRANELIIDAIGMAASITAAAAAFIAYPLRNRIWVRIYLTLVIVFAVAYTFEFFVGFLWFAADKFKTFG